MPTPTGQISLDDVNIELGIASGTQINMNDADVRALAGVPTGQIAMSDLQGKTGPEYVAATGGTVSTNGNYKVHKFTSSGTFTVTSAGNAAGSNTIEYVIVAGGGGGGSQLGGGGGGGGYVTSSVAASTGAKSVVIGGGGGGGASAGGSSGNGSVGSNGSNSSVTGMATAIGGGGGGCFNAKSAGSGGCGGGGAFDGGSRGTGSQGGDGQTSGGTPSRSGGGGGAGEDGGTDGDGQGGDGLSNSFTGSSYEAGGGGGAGETSGTAGIGGSGGGGNGGQNANGSSGATNQGGGGGGGAGDVHSGGNGGSGVVFIRYIYQQVLKMGHYAKVVDGIVTEVIVAKQDFIDTLPSEETWIKTSYNTMGGVHYKPTVGGNIDIEKTPSADQSKSLRKNYASIGYIYDSVRDAFYEPQPYASWTLNETTCLWHAPVPYPTDGQYYLWNETDLRWDLSPQN